MATPAARPPRILIDTGPLVAWLDSSEPWHATVAAWLADYRGELLSTWPVLTEVCHLVPERKVANFMRWVGRGGLSVVDIPASAVPLLADRIDKYADLPMDLADASLIWLAETRAVLDILTLDRSDFGIYRTARGLALRNHLVG
ncbi:MAG: hypothetical protein RLZZ584_3228 [Pseudomonadota bacterium]|jgi:predicted nucleic acid-binding protein